MPQADGPQGSLAAARAAQALQETPALARKHPSGAPVCGRLQGLRPGSVRGPARSLAPVSRRDEQSLGTATLGHRHGRHSSGHAGGDLIGSKTICLR